MVGEADEGSVEAGVHDVYAFGLCSPRLRSRPSCCSRTSYHTSTSRKKSESRWAAPRCPSRSRIAATQVFRARLLVILLSIHSLIAGMAIGSATAVAPTVAILIAIIAHKGPEGYALGLSLYEAGRERSDLIRTVLLYSVMTPIGIVIGTLLAEVLTGDAQILAEAIFDGLAGGTFLYIATLGILKEEYAKPEYRWPKYTATVLAVALIALVSVWA